MKKQILLLSAFCFTIFSASAQITLTTADIETPNHLIYSANDTMPNIPIGVAGATSQNWNMTTLAQHTTDTLNFIPYAWQPNVNYPTSNLVVKQGWQNQYRFALNDAAGFSFLGNGGTVNLFGFPTTVNQINTPAEKVVAFPDTLNSNFLNDYIAHAKFAYGHQPTGIPVFIDSIRTKSDVHKTVVVDAWGSLTTPLGTYNVLRSTETKINHDTIDAYFLFQWNPAVYTAADSVVTYTWWANGIGFPLVTATTDSIGDVKSASWLLALPTQGVNEFPLANQEFVFPNPAQNEINFLGDASKQKSAQVFDIAGRIIDEFLITNNQTTINTSAYANGIYTYSILGKDNAILTRGKFTIVK